MDGVPGGQVKDKIASLEERKAELEAALDQSVEEPILLHPNMSAHYRKKVENLIEALNDEEGRLEAAELIRALVDAIVLRPHDASGEPTFLIDIKGDLAGILALAADAKSALSGSAPSNREITLVAGVRFEPTTFRL